MKQSGLNWRILTVFAAIAFLLFSSGGQWARVMTGALAMHDDNDDNTVRIAGPVVTLPNTDGWIGEWVVARTKVTVASATKIDQTRGKVAIGALVEIKGVKQNDGSISATEVVVKLSPNGGLPVKFTGKIEELPSTPGRDGDWKVSGKTVHVTSATKIDQERGQVAVDAIVEVEGLAQNDGSINALEIEVKPDLSNGIPVRFTGKVETLPSTTGRIGDWVVSGRTIHVTDKTVLKQDKGQVMIGSLVLIEGLVQLDGSVLANTVEVKNDFVTPNLRVHFRGVIESLPGTTDFTGDWKVSGRTVQVSAETKVDTEGGKIEVGVNVEVSGILNSDGTVKALIIVVRGKSPVPGYVKFIGVIKSLPPTTSSTPNFVGDWKVGERTVHVSADTKIDQDKGKVQVGALVEVEGVVRNDGTVEAKEIEVKHVFNDTANYLRFFGKIEALPGGNTLTGDWTVGGKTVHVGDRTRIRREHGRVEVGAYVEVEGNQRTDGSIDAYKIEVEQDADAPDGAVGFINFYGQIKTLPEDTNFVGKWTVGDKTVVVTDATKINQRRGQVKVDAYVEVKGYLLDDGSVKAIKIEVRPALSNTNVNRSWIEFIGTIKELPTDPNYIGVWVVGNRKVNVDSHTRIKRENAKVTVGATVEIVGAEISSNEIDAKEIEVEHGPAGAGFVEFASLSSVNAGSYQLNNSSNSIIASFGSNLSNRTMIANSLPLPTSLGGVSVLVDGQPAGLFFVSPSQVNYLAPDNLAPGSALVTVIKDGNVVAQGSLTLETASPSVFTSNANGQGVPAGLLLRVKSNGQQSFEPLARFESGRFVPVSITRQAGDRLFLVVYGTGLRDLEDTDGNSANGVAENLQVTIGNSRANVIFAGAAPGFAGLDQINIEIPASANGSNITLLIKVSDGEGKLQRANPVTISIN